MQTKNQVFTIPNILSVVRIAMIPFILWTYCIGEIYVCAGLICASALTDVVDGFIARRFNMVSPIGKALDPIADKLTLCSILIILCIGNLTILPLLLIFVLKEFLMGIQSLMVIKHTGTTYSARWYGKLSTLVLYSTLLVFILWTKMPKIATYVFLAFCVFVVVFSFVMYTITNLKQIKTTQGVNEEQP